MSEKRYYWLKLPRDFFKRHDIKFIKTLPNGREIAFFYLELMAESVDHDGQLRFSPNLPYSENMLSALTDTPIEIVTEAMKVLKEFGLVVISEDGTIILPKVIKMIDSASDTDEARRQRRCRERKKAERDKMSREIVTGVTVDVTNSNESKSKSKSKSKSIKENIQEKSSHFIPPTLTEVKIYCQERNNGVNPEKWFNFYQAKNWMIGKNKMIDWRAAVRTWEHGDNQKQKPQSTGNQFFDLLNQEASS